MATVAVQKLTCKLPHTVGWTKTKPIKLGTVSFKKAGVYHLVLSADPRNWRAVNVWGLEFTGEQ